LQQLIDAGPPSGPIRVMCFPRTVELWLAVSERRESNVFQIPLSVLFFAHGVPCNPQVELEKHNFQLHPVVYTWTLHVFCESESKIRLYLDVKANYGGELRQKVMVPNHRGFINVGYKTRNKRWEFDVTASVFGESRLPQVMLADSSFSTDNKSNVYPMVNAQITHVYKRWDFYIGGENLTNYTQKNPIIDAENPFNPTFNATRIWAPIIGLNVYAGVRFSIKQKEEKETVQTEMDGHDH